jgi:hypothetical protein
VGRSRSDAASVVPSLLSHLDKCSHPRLAQNFIRSQGRHPRHTTSRAHTTRVTHAAAHDRGKRESVSGLRFCGLSHKRKDTIFPRLCQFPDLSAPLRPVAYAALAPAPRPQQAVFMSAAREQPKRPSTAGGALPIPVLPRCVEGPTTPRHICRAPARRAAAHSALSPIPHLCRVAPAPISSGMSFRSLPDPSLAQVRKDNRRDGPPTSLRASPT